MKEDIIENPRCIKCSKKIEILVYKREGEFILCDKCAEKYKVLSNHQINDEYLTSILEINSFIEKLNKKVEREQERLIHIGINKRNILNKENEILLKENIKKLQNFKIALKEIKENTIKED